MQVNKIDTGGEGIEGRIVIIDISKTDSAGRPLKTVYTRIGATYEKKSYYDVYNTQTGIVTQNVQSANSATGRSSNLDTNSLPYYPLSGSRYGWATGLGTITQTTAKYITTSSWGGWSRDTSRPPDESSTRALSNAPLLEGDYLQTNTGLSQVFVLGYRNDVLAERTVDEYKTKSTSGWGPWKKTKTTYYFITEKSAKDIYTYSLKGDYGVAVSFIGADAGTIISNRFGHYGGFCHIISIHGCW